MRPCPFVPDRAAIRSHYINQVGGNLPVFVGKPYQEGYGIGGLLRGLLRVAIPVAKTASRAALRAAKPVLKRTAKAVGKEALKAGKDILRDVVVERKNVRRSIKRRAGESLLKVPDIVTATVQNKPQLGQKRRSEYPIENTAKRVRDIFD